MPRTSSRRHSPGWPGPGAITYDRDGHVVNVFALDIADGAVQAIRCVVNPDKLRHLGPVSELARKPPPTGQHSVWGG